MFTDPDIKSANYKTVAQVAREIGRSSQYVRNLIHEGRLAAVQIVPSGAFGVTAADVADLILRSRVEPAKKLGRPRKVAA